MLLQLRQLLGIDAMRGKEVRCDTQCKAWLLSLPEAVTVRLHATLNRPLPQARASTLASTSHGACGGVLMAPSSRKFAVKSLASNGAMTEVQTAVAGRCVLGWGDACWVLLILEFQLGGPHSTLRVTGSAHLHFNLYLSPRACKRAAVLTSPHCCPHRLVCCRWTAQACLAASNVTTMRPCW